MSNEKRVVIFDDEDRAKIDTETELETLIEEGALPRCRLKLPKGYLSVSQVLTYMRCPMQFYWRYIRGVVVPPKARMVEGTAVHHALEIGHRMHKKTGKPAPLDVFLDAHSDAWKSGKKKIEKWEDGETAKDIEGRAQIFLTEYHDEYVPKIRPVGIERRFWIVVGPSEIPVVGFIDLVDEEEENKPTIVDHKVVSKSKTQPEADGDMQLTMYSHATSVPNVRFDSFVKLKKPKITTVRSTRTPRDGAWAERVFESTAQAISKGIFPVCDPASWACTEKWCGYYRLCRGKK